MSEVELERMVVRLLGDGEQYVKMLNDAAKATTESAAKIEHAATKIEGFQHRIEGFAHGAEKALMSIGLAVGAMHAFDKFDAAERTMTKLESAIEGNGNSVEDTVKEYKKFASEMEKVSATSKGATLQMLHQAEAMGLTGEKAQRAVKNAIALAKTQPGESDPMGLVRMTAMLEQGKMGRIGMLLGMGELEEGADKVEEALKKLEKRFGTVEKLANDNDEQIKRMQNAMGGLSKEIGSYIAIAAVPLVTWLEKTALWLTKSDTTIRDVIIVAGLLIGTTIALATAWGTLTMVMGRVGAVLSVLTWVLPALQVGVLNLTMATWGFAASLTATNAAAMLFGGGLLLAALLPIILILKSITSEQDKLNKSLEEGKKLAEDMAKINRDRLNKTIQKADSMGDLRERREFLEKEIKAAKEAADAADKIAKAATANREKVEGGTGSWVVRQFNYAGAGKQAELAEAKAQEEEMKKVHEEAEKNLKELETKMKGAQAATNEELAKSIKEVTDKLKFEAETAYMTAQEIEVYKLAQKGATAAQQEAVAESLEANRVAKETQETRKKLIESGEDMVKSLQREIDAQGLSTEGAKRYALAKEGLNDATLKEIDTLIAAKEAGSAHQKILDSIKETTKQFQTPLEEFNARQKELNEQLAAGLSMDTYNRALESARKKFDEATAAANKFESQVTKLDNALSGSAEAQARVQAYLDTMNRQKPNERAPGAAGGGTGGGQPAGFTGTPGVTPTIPAGSAIELLLQKIEANTRKDDTADKKLIIKAAGA